MCALLRATGMSWFGCEGRGFTFTGLNYTSMDTILNWMAHNKYNVIRMPVSVTFALSDPATTFPEKAFVSKDLHVSQHFPIGHMNI